MPRLRSFACQLWFILRHWLAKPQTPVPAHFPVQAMAAVFHPVYRLHYFFCCYVRENGFSEVQHPERYNALVIINGLLIRFLTQPPYAGFLE
jgi:hypothetical protein